MSKAVASVSCVIIAAWLTLLAFLVLVDRLVMELESSLLRSTLGLALLALWVILWYAVSARLVERKASELRKRTL